MSNVLRNARGPIMRRHPITGAPIEPLGIVGDRVVWPVMGGDENAGTGNNGGGGGGGQGAGGGSGDGSGSGGSGTGEGGESQLGFPRDTPVAEMTVDQQAAYWKHQSRKHESAWKGIVGDRKVEDVKNDLTEYAKIQQEKLTPSEKAIQEAEQRGRQAASAESNTKAARAILRASLEARGIKDTDNDPALTDLVESLNVDRFIADGDVDTAKLASFANRFGTTDTVETKTKRRRDFGGGQRGDSGDKPRGAAGKAEAERRFGKPKTTTGA